LLNLTWKEVNDFEIGDEFHTREGHGHSYSSPTRTLDTSVAIQIVTGKVLLGDTIMYTMKNTSKRYFFNANFGVITSSTSFNYKIDTVFVTSNKVFDALPGESASIQKYDLRFGGEGGLEKLKIGFSSLFFTRDDSCYFHLVVYESGFSNRSYWKGLGGPYTPGACDVFFNYECTYRELRYYKKGTKTWGNPFPAIVLHTDNDVISTEMSLSPNPVSNLLKITAFADEYIEITDLTGKVLETFRVNGQSQLLDVSHYHSGMYVCRSARKTLKFIVE